MANELQIKNGLILSGINSQTTTYGLSFDPTTGKVGFMSTSSFGSGSNVTGTSGAGTAGYISKWNTGTSLNNSIIYQDGSNVGIGTITPGSSKLYVAGTTTITGDVSLGSGLNVTGVTKLLGVTPSVGNATNVLMVNTATGQLYYTASSAVGAGSVDVTQFVLNSKTGSFAITGSNTFIGNQTISGSLITTGSVNFTNLTTESQQWVVTYNSASGQLYYTASSAIGGGTANIDTNKFITTGSNNLTQIITGSLTISDYLKLGTAPFPTWASNTGSRFDSINYYNNPTTSSWITDTMARWVRSFYGSSSVTNLSTYRNQAVAFQNQIELAPGQTYNIAATNWDTRKTGMTSLIGIGVSGSNGALTTYNSGYTLNSTNYGMVSILDTWPEFDAGTNIKRYNGQYAIYGGTFDIYAASGSSAEKFMFYTAGGLKYFVSTSIDNLTNYYSTLETQSFSTSRINNVYGFYSAPLSKSYVTKAYGFYQSGSNDINYFEGKVGIGKLPTTDLDVSGSLIVSGNVILGDATTDTITLNANTITLGTGTGTLNIDSNTLFVDGNNNRVGIGVNSPDTKLEVSGSNVSTNVLRVTTLDTQTDLTDTTLGATIGTYNRSTALNTYSLISLSHGSGPTAIARLGSKLISTTNGTGLYNGDFFIQVRNGSSTLDTALYIKANSNIGIGTTTPGYKLDVNGTGNYRNDLTVTGSLIVSGATSVKFDLPSKINGYSLVTDSNGNATWQPVGAAAGFPFTGSALISGSLTVTGSVLVSGSGLGVTGSLTNNGYNVIRNVVEDPSLSSALTGAGAQTTVGLIRSYLIPANTYSTTGFLKIQSCMFQHTGLAGTGSCFIYINTSASLTSPAATKIAGQVFSAANQYTNITRTFAITGSQIIGWNANNEQASDYANHSNAIGAYTFNPAVNNYILIAGLLQSGSDSLYHRGICITN